MLFIVGRADGLFGEGNDDGFPDDFFDGSAVGGVIGRNYGRLVGILADGFMKGLPDDGALLGCCVGVKMGLAVGVTERLVVG